ncbi:MAG TPA: cyclic nucleotide-binding protein, partial [Rhodospirillaceae bacterium]|nr:cyclic nucleotide-binding protein [Rhodospirillaceae bacterium]
KEELLEAGMAPDLVDDYMEVKLAFAFGAIKEPENLIDSCVVGPTQVEIRNGVHVRRLSLNVYEITYDGESETIDLNLADGEHYEPPYPLGFQNIERGFFTVIHSGEADGWDIHRPCMSSVLIFHGRIYLIDAGPNLQAILNALGIGIAEIEGIFHSHAHDDHFSGLTTLMRSDRKIKYFATRLVRASVTKKLSALLSISEEEFENYFEICDLEFDEWNNVQGMDVKPVLTLHPVEDSIFFFRAAGADREYTYAHLADTASFDIMDKMAAGELAGRKVSKELIAKTKEAYLTPVDLKKIDIGGGIIHGEARDYADDKSKKLLFCHVARPLDSWERGHGEGAPFGTTEALIPTYQNYERRGAFDYMKAHFADIPADDLATLLNNPTVMFNPQSILLRAGEVPEYIYLVLTGTVEYVDPEGDFVGQQMAGSFVGEFATLSDAPAARTYRANCFVKVLQIHVNMYRQLFEKFSLTSNFYEISKIRRFLQRTWLFGEGVSNPVLNNICRGVSVEMLDDGDEIAEASFDKVYVVGEGALDRNLAGSPSNRIEVTETFGETVAMFGEPSQVIYRAIGPTKLYGIEPGLLRDVPVVQWKLLELFRQDTWVDEAAE